jgi:hypothetical protein
MLKSIKDIDRGDDDAKAHWTANRLRFISIVMPRALSAAIEFSGAHEYPRLNALIPHACRVTADAVDFSRRQGTIEEYFPAGFRVNLLHTFEIRAFSASGDVDPSYQLKALLTEGVSDSPVHVIVMQPSFEDPRAARRTPGSATARDLSEGLRRAAHDPHSRPPNSVDFAPGREESSVGGLGNLELHDVSGAAGLAAPDLAAHHAGISSSEAEPQEEQDGGEWNGEGTDYDDDDDDDKVMDETEQPRQRSSGGSGRGFGRGGRRRARGRAHRLGHAGAGRFESDPGSTEESRSSSRPR